jgi:hypothetical protein
MLHGGFLKPSERRADHWPYGPGAPNKNAGAFFQFGLR